MKIQMLSIGALALLLAGCGKQESVSVPVPSEESAPSLTEVFQTVAAVDEMSISKLKPDAKAGDEIVLEGKVMGAMEPFVENRAIVIVGDEATLTSCDLKAKDHCTTPWDVCCDSPEAVLAGTATIQIVDGEGQVLKAGLKGVNGVKELSRLRVKGTVVHDAADAALLINAEAIEVL